MNWLRLPVSTATGLIRMFYFVYFQIPQDNVGPGRPPREGEEEVVITILEQSGISREIQ